MKRLWAMYDRRWNGEHEIDCIGTSISQCMISRLILPFKNLLQIGEVFKKNEIFDSKPLIFTLSSIISVEGGYSWNFDCNSFWCCAAPYENVTRIIVHSTHYSNAKPILKHVTTTEPESWLYFIFFISKISLNNQKRKHIKINQFSTCWIWEMEQNWAKWYKLVGQIHLISEF